MKKITFIFALFIAAQATAQDSSNMLIRLSLKQKHIAFMGAELSDRNTLKDLRIRDTLAARIGSGTKPDSVTTGSYPAHFVLKFLQKVSDEQAAVINGYLNELTKDAGNVITQLNTKISGNQPDKAAAIWLKGQLITLQAAKQAVLTEKLKAGVEWLKADL